VTVQGSQDPYFARIFGLTKLNTAATAVAVHRPRDVAFVLDFSGSMRFGSVFNWAYYYQLSSNPNPDAPPDGGMLNPDPDYPQFGHYQRYTDSTRYQSTNPNAAPRGSSGRPNPLYMTGSFVNAAGDLYAPNNYTIETSSGPQCVKDFYYDTANVSNPTTLASTVNPANLRMAFHRWNPPLASAGNPSTYNAPTYNFSGYDALNSNDTTGPVPAPHSYRTQAAGTRTPATCTPGRTGRCSRTAGTGPLRRIPGPPGTSPSTSAGSLSSARPSSGT
jgi:hypothetical protein